MGTGIVINPINYLNCNSFGLMFKVHKTSKKINMSAMEYILELFVAVLFFCVRLYVKVLY
jgi:hypothetical protein